MSDKAETSRVIWCKGCGCKVLVQFEIPRECSACGEAVFTTIRPVKPLTRDDRFFLKSIRIQSW